MKRKEVLKSLEPLRLPMAVLLVILAVLGLVGALFMGMLLMAFSTDSGADPSGGAFLFGFGIFGVPSLILVLGAWGVVKRKLWAWVVAGFVSIPLAMMVVRFLF